MSAVRPIRSEDDYENALRQVEELWGAAAGTPEGDQLDVLATLIDAYERDHFPIDPPDPLSAIAFRMEQLGLTRRDLEGVIGSRGRIAEVLNGQRPLTISMIRRLHDRFGISADVLIKPTTSTPTRAHPTGVQSNRESRRPPRRPQRSKQVEVSKRSTS